MHSACWSLCSMRQSAWGAVARSRRIAASPSGLDAIERKPFTFQLMKLRGRDATSWLPSGRAIGVFAPPFYYKSTPKTYLNK